MGFADKIYIEYFINSVDVNFRSSLGNMNNHIQ